MTHHTEREQTDAQTNNRRQPDLRGSMTPLDGLELPISIGLKRIRFEGIHLELSHKNSRVIYE